MTSKRGMLLLVLIILTISLAATALAAQPADCNNAGGIWCSGASTCVKPSDKPDLTTTTECIVSDEQIVNMGFSSLDTFSFKKLDLTSTGHLRFYAQPVWYPENYPFTGGTPGDGGTGKFANNGGQGGQGGNTTGWGAPGSHVPETGIQMIWGIGGTNVPHCGGQGADIQQKTGADIIISANQLTINGVLDTSGWQGNTGMSARCNTMWGFGGGGGSGGSGAGNIILAANTITGSGKILAQGGQGGQGGKSNQQSGEQCAGYDSSNGPGGGGGGGGGGAGAKVYYTSAQIPPTINVNNTGGPGGPGGCSGWAEEGKVGKQGNPTTATPPEKYVAPELCNNGIDDNSNLLIDMDDPYCYSMVDGVAWTKGWDTSIRDQYDLTTTSWYDPSAQNGNDLSCGDDLNVQSTNTNYLAKDECYPTQEYPCASYNDATSCTADSLCQWTTGVPPWTTSGCSFKSTNSLCSASKNETDCSTKDYCDWGVAPCAVNLDACSKWTTQTMCELSGSDLCYWDAGTCNLNTSTTYSCAESSYPSGGNAMCNSLVSMDLCAWSKISTGFDIGYILPDQAYACFDNKKSSDGTLAGPGNNFTWRSADVFSQQSPYVILQADKTHFISNNINWTYCDASGESLYGTVGALGEGQTFIPEFPDGQISCVSTLGLLNVSGQKARAMLCDTDIAECKTQAETDGYTAFCKNVGGEKATYHLGEFLDTCGPSSPEICMLKTDGGWKSLQQYYSENNPQEWCTVLGQQEPMCTGTGTQNNFNPGDLTINSDLCDGRDTTACLPTGYDPTQACEATITGQGWTYIEQDRICSSTQYCKDGTSVFSAENQTTPTCCYGETAYCEEFTDAQCTEAGGELLPNYFTEQDILDGKVECLGNNPEGTTCCLGGTWAGDANAFMGDQEVNNSFICYQEADGNYLKECCGSGLCYNSPEKNPLTEYYSKVPSGLYSLAGSRLHNLMTFDDGQQNKYRLVANKDGNQSFTLAQGELNYYLTDWSGFDILEFDISFNLPYVESIIISDGNSNNATYDLQENIINGYVTNRWLHAKINLKKSDYPTIDWKNITKIEIGLSGTTQTKVSMLFDNFVLSDSTGTQNTENYYCTGDWKQWITNLDGPSGDKGFFDEPNQPTLSEFGPYQYACDSTAAFGWTGRLCCGDDTAKGTHGEYYVDGAGACWNGTIVANDQTVAYAVGTTVATNVENSLLYYDDGTSTNKLWACNSNPSDYNSYSFSFNGTDTTTQNYGQYAQRSEIFSIKGSWMCQDGGWVKLEDVNRIRLIATALKNYADESGNGQKYTLMCGEYKDLSNIYPTNLPFENYTKKACVLRIGTNANTNEKIVLGLELDKTKTLDDFSEMLRYFAPFNDTTTLTCLNAPEDPTESDFFTKCEDVMGEYGAENFKFYYNKPFNIIIMGDSYIESQVFSNNLIVTMWESFVQFFSRLFNPGISIALPQNLTENPDITDFYIAQQEQKTILGIMEGGQNVFNIRVDYENLHNDVEILSKAAKANYPTTQVRYNASGYNQTIYINGTTRPSWKLFTGLLRLNKEGAPKNFDMPSSN